MSETDSQDGHGAENVIPLPTGAELEAVARHEAIHVVVGFVLGSYVSEVTIVPSQDANGDWREGVAKFISLTNPLVNALVSLAPTLQHQGPEGELNGDYAKGSNALSRWFNTIGPPASDDDFQARLSFLETTSRGLQEAFAPMIDTLTAELVKRRTMSGTEVADVLWSVSGSKRFATSKVTFRGN